MTKETFYARLRELILLLAVAAISWGVQWLNNDRDQLDKINRNVRRGNQEVKEVKEQVVEMKQEAAALSQPPEAATEIP